MKILGLDYGRKKVGLAIAESALAEPIAVIRYEKLDNLVKNIQSVVDKEQVEKIVVGISEGSIGEETMEFSRVLAKRLGIPVTTFDETLSTHEALIQSIEAGIQRKKRKSMEDAYAATIMLQNYLDALL